MNHTSKETSEAYKSPMSNLMTAIVLQAVRDLGVWDPILALDALCFWLDPAGGLAWLDALPDYPQDPTEIFTLAVKGANNGTKEPIRVSRRSTRANERKPGRPIQVRAGEKSTRVYKEHSNQGAALVEIAA